VEALYSADANPVTDQLALDAIRRLAAALPKIAADPSDTNARSDALQAAWLAGTCLATVGMGLHHKLCHTLGGSFGLATRRNPRCRIATCHGIQQVCRAGCDATDRRRARGDRRAQRCP